VFAVLGNDESHKDWGKVRTLLTGVGGAAKSLWAGLYAKICHKGTFALRARHRCSGCPSTNASEANAPFYVGDGSGHERPLNDEQ
jgi:shikimate 5-dehydrogenase